MRRSRLDQELVRRGMFDSRTAAHAAIESGVVLVNGAVADKASRQVSTADAIVITERARYVGRGGEKLEAAFEHFTIVVAGRDALDVGSSTGGFTDCLLQHGASSVVAIDVGHNQLHERLRKDPRVKSHEGLHIKDASTAVVGGPFSLIVVDLSFISLKSVADHIVALAASGADLVLLVKPQFEAGRTEVSKGQGIIRDEEIRQRTLAEVTECYVAKGFTMEGVIDCPVPGANGNVEFLLWLRAEERRGS